MVVVLDVGFAEAFDLHELAVLLLSAHSQQVGHDLGLFLLVSHREMPVARAIIGEDALDDDLR